MIKILQEKMSWTGPVKCDENVPSITVQFRDSIVVSIPACHAGDPGSIPGRGVFLSKL